LCRSRVRGLGFDQSRVDHRATTAGARARHPPAGRQRPRPCQGVRQDGRGRHRGIEPGRPRAGRAGVRRGRGGDRLETLRPQESGGAGREVRAPDAAQDRRARRRPSRTSPCARHRAFRLPDPLGLMGESRLAALFLTILAAGTALVVAMVALLVQFTDGAEEAAVWRALMVAMAGAGVGLSVAAIVHLSLIASRRAAYLRREARVVSWTEAWCAVAAGADTPTVKPVDTDVAAEGAALVLQDLTGEGAQRIRQALRDGGVIEAELSLATRGLLGQAGDSTAALGRLAWIAVPEALPLFEVASTGSERASRAALLGVMRVLAEQRKPEQVGSSVVLAIEEHVTASRDPEATRPYLTAVMMAAGENLPWLCRELLGNNATACVQV